MTTPVRKILIAEDDRLLMRASSAALRRHGFEVVAAVDGEEALAMALSAAPDLILLDVIMPKLDGIEVLSRLKAEPATASIPVIMLSNLGQPRDVEEALAAGAVAYCVKSDLRGDELAAKVTAVLDQA
ncbi:MAG: response regulator [Vicinamibacterales bacterium]